MASTYELLEDHYYKGGDLASAFNPKLSKSFYNFLNANGDLLVTDMIFVREPIADIFMKALDGLSAGEVSARIKATGEDTYFHLFLILKCIDPRNGKVVYVRTEKNSVPQIGMYTPALGVAKFNEQVQLSIIPPVSIRNMINNAIKNVGESRLARYDAFNANCQVYVSDLYKGASGKDLPPIQKDFIFDDVQGTLKGFLAKGVAKILPTFGSFLSRLFD